MSATELGEGWRQRLELGGVQVQSDGQRGARCGADDGVLDGGPPDQQSGAADDTTIVGNEDRFVDSFGNAEIICIHHNASLG